MRSTLLVFSVLVGLLLCTSPALAVRGHVLQTSFGSEGTGNGQFKTPAGIAVNEATGVVYVADQGLEEKVTGSEALYHDGRVEWFTYNTSEKGYEYGGQFNGNGTLANEHGKRAGYGGLATEEETGQFIAPKGVAVDNTCYRDELDTGKTLDASECKALDPSNGDVYVVDSRHEVVDKFTSEGEYIGQITARTVKALLSEIQRFRLLGVAVGPQGEAWVAEGYKVGVGSKAKINFDKLANTATPTIDELVNASNAPPFSEVIESSERGFAVDDKGDLYLGASSIEELSGSSRFLATLKFNDTGSLLAGLEAGATSDGLAAEAPNSALYGSSDSVYVDIAGGRVERFASEFTESPALEVFGEGEGGCISAICEQRGIAVDSATGQIFVGAQTSDEVRVYGLEPASAPSVANESASEVRNDGASLVGEVDPRGFPGERATDYWFEYGACGSLTSCAASGFEGRISGGTLDSSFEVAEAHAQVSGLRAGTEYHFRLVAENARGMVGGEEGVFTTWGTGVFGLPDGRAWEMVSPPDKHGALIEPIGEQWAIQAAAQGGAMVYEARSPTESSSAGYLLYQPVLATRGSSGGWSSRDLAVPHALPTTIPVGTGGEFRFFSEDLSHAIVQPMGPFTPCEPERDVHQPCISSEASEQTAFLGADYAGGGSGGKPCTSSCFTPLVTAANTPAGTKFGGVSTLAGECPPKPFCGPEFTDATPDLSHVILESNAALTPSSALGVEIPHDSLYEWSEGRPASEQLRLISVLPGNEKGEALPAGNSYVGMTESGGKPNDRHVISPDGERVEWHTHAEGVTHQYLRVNATRPQSPLGEHGECLVSTDACTIQLDAGLPGRTRFQTANAQVTRIFFTEEGEAGGVIEDNLADLYEYNVNRRERVPMIIGADVVRGGVSTSEDGSWAYVVAKGALAPGAVAGFPNLYVLHDEGSGWGTPRLVAVLSNSDLAEWGASKLTAELTLVEMTTRVSPNGRWLTFMSNRSLTGFDNRDAVSGEPDQEVYEYDAVTGGLVCASCNPVGVRPHGVPGETLASKDGGLAGGETPSAGWVAGNIPGWTPDRLDGVVYQSRYLSDSGRLFFDASDQLVPKDLNGAEDVYEFEPDGVPAGSENACSSKSASGSVVFEPARSARVESRTIEEYAGCVGLISSGESSEESAFLDADETGSEVFFLTSGKLAGEDVDTLRDVYVARECSSTSPCATPLVSAPKPCDNEASCKAAPSPQPALFGPSGSATFSGPGNLIAPLSGALAVKKQPSSSTRALKLARALKACHGYRDRRKRATCEKRANKLYGTKTKGRAGR